MTIAVYFFASLFVVISVLMFWAYGRVRHYGLFVMALTYGASAGLAFVLADWWPLALGFALVWVLRMAGVNPDDDLLGRAAKRGEKRTTK
ncbi:MAG: hypothetical protein IT529_01660 [Burkholderiales bacterium]|nr:hypothetical protein [Burkholderiales bacterium]